MKTLREILDNKCSNCEGEGFTTESEHDSGCNGDVCVDTCPITVQVQCDCIGIKAHIIRLWAIVQLPEKKDLNNIQRGSEYLKFKGFNEAIDQARKNLEAKE